MLVAAASSTASYHFTLLMLTNHFCGTDRAVGRVYVYVCVSVSLWLDINFELNDFDLDIWHNQARMARRS